jgi:ubiquinone/menaquinone biosynthesis C-methylase UbiE
MNNRGAPIEYKVMDMLNMTFDDASFNFALDKGTLDALCADKNPETITKVKKYFNEIARVLNNKGGTYVCVSLLQDFVLEELVSFFSKGNGNNHFTDNIFEFRIHKVDKILQKGGDEGSHYLPFYITIKKTKITDDSML